MGRFHKSHLAEVLVWNQDGAGVCAALDRLLLVWHAQSFIEQHKALENICLASISSIASDSAPSWVPPLSPSDLAM